MRARRGRAGRGFSLIEALVALSVGAMALALMGGAGWGLRLASPPAAQRSGPEAVLAARRVLRDAAFGAARDLSGRRALIAGDAADLQVIAQGGGADRGRMTAFSIRRREGGGWRLSARRAAGTNDIRLAAENEEATLMLEGDGTAAFAYLLADPVTRMAGWVSELPASASLPLAVALDVDGARVLTAQVPTTADPLCLARTGLVALEDRSCAAR